MTRARILADYVSGGTTAAEFDYLDGVTSNVQTQMDLKAPLASPAITGTPSVTLGSDATGDVYYRAAGGALTRLATGAAGTVLTSTGAGAVPAFEALPAGSRLKATDSYWTNAAVNINKTGGGSVDNDVLISGAHYLTITPDATTDILEFGYTFNIWAGATFGFFGWGVAERYGNRFWY